MADDTPEKPKSRRGGKRPGAGRKPRGWVRPTALADIDLEAAMAAPVPGDIASVAQDRAGEALRALVKQVMHGASESAKVAACNAILDRGYGKPAVDLGGDPMLPFASKPTALELGPDMRTEARKYAQLCVEVLTKIASNGQSESARVSAAKSLWDRGLGTVALAKVPEQLRDQNRPLGKREEMQRAATAAATGRYAVPAPPSGALN